MKMRKKIYIGLVGIGMVMASCGRPSVPEVYTDVKELPRIYPDYTNVTVPINIAPLTFELDDVADEVVSRYAVGDEELTFEGKVQPDIDEWRRLTAKAKGSAIKVDVFTRYGGEWKHYKPFNIYVSADSIDPYLSYRLIPP